MGKLHLRVAGAFIHVADKILIVRRHLDSSDGGTWALPSGKLELGEDSLTAVVRELNEELSLAVQKSECTYLGTFDWDFPKLKISYSTYALKYSSLPNIKLKEDELIDYSLETLQDVYLRTDLIKGFHDLLEYVGYIK